MKLCSSKILWLSHRSAKRPCTISIHLGEVTPCDPFQTPSLIHLLLNLIYHLNLQFLLYPFLFFIIVCWRPWALCPAEFPVWTLLIAVPWLSFSRCLHLYFLSTFSSWIQSPDQTQVQSLCKIISGSVFLHQMTHVFLSLAVFLFC